MSPRAAGVPPARPGITIPFDGIPLHAHRDWFARLRELGYTDLWSAEVDGSDGFTPLALAAASVAPSALSLFGFDVPRSINEKTPITKMDANVFRMGALYTGVHAAKESFRARPGARARGSCAQGLRG